MISRWYKSKIMLVKKILTLLIIVMAASVCVASPSVGDKELVALSGKLLLNVKSDLPTEAIELQLSKLKMTDLMAALGDDNAKKTFWINIYNAYFQILVIRDKKTISEVFTGEFFTIAQTKFSLDDVEHGILRRYRFKYSLGYFPQFFPSQTIKDLAVSKIDFRIHFALNCGAVSCPPIAFYDYDKIDKQLETATYSFLKNDTEINAVTKTVKVSKILQWFKADFGGESGIKTILLKYLKTDFANYSVSYKVYNKSEKLKNFDVN